MATFHERLEQFGRMLGCEPQHAVHIMNTKAKILSDNEVELRIKVRIRTRNRDSARCLAAMAEADLIDYTGDTLRVRRAKCKLRKNEKLDDEIRHGFGLFTIVRDQTKKLYAAFDLETPYDPKAPKHHIG